MTLHKTEPFFSLGSPKVMLSQMVLILILSAMSTLSSQKVGEGCSLNFLIVLAWVSVVKLSSYMALSKLLNLFEPGFYHLLTDSKIPIITHVMLRQTKIKC